MSSQEKQIRDICALLVEGNREGDIAEYMASVGLSVKEFAAQLEAAFALLEKEADVPVGIRNGWCLLAAREVFRRLMATGDYSGAVRAVDLIAKLSGAYPSKAMKRKVLAGPAEDPDEEDPFADLPDASDID